ncbi:hypothetical protein HYC85_026178 [Camellia sinensis]|uniref:Uncharacterized protein n=1 Tax=Camellia sinensis TaxID=4442 RepID=A0A7J7G2Y7_CAMSI|nr:hypothetical protein HYC85_026178 [Camellia sinensis]
MGISKTEINLRRLLAAASHQQNQAKLIHYVATLREQLEQLAEERTSDGLPRVSKAQVNDYSEKIEALAAKLAALVSESVLAETLQPISVTSVKESPSKAVGESFIPTSPGLRRRFVLHQTLKIDLVIRLSNWMLQHGLILTSTDEMVGLAQQLKESGLMMSQSLQNTEKILDSTEHAVEQSLPSTGHANVHAMDIYSKSFKTTCFTLLLIFVMTCIFIMVVLLIRVT